MESNTRLEAEHQAARSERFDPSALWEAVGEDMKLLSELVQIFSIEYPDILSSIEHSIKQGDTIGVRRASHKLKGALFQLAAPKAAGMAESLERCANARPAKDLAFMVEQLRAELDSLLPLLNAMISKHPQGVGDSPENSGHYRSS